MQQAKVGPNQRENCRDWRLACNQTGKRHCIVRERGGESVPPVFRTESAALSFIRNRVKPGTVVHVEEASSWDALQARFEMKRINHQLAYGDREACTNWAEEYFSRLRRAEIGHHHHVARVYLLRNAQEASWREDNRHVPNVAQYKRVAGLAMKREPFVDFCGYWQWHQRSAPTSA